MKNRVQNFLLTNYHGLLIDPISLSYAFEKLEKYQTEINQDPHLARIGCEITLTNMSGLTISGITLTGPKTHGPWPQNFSCLSPLGAAVLNAKKGQQIFVYLLGKIIKFKVLCIRNVMTIKGGD
jgi:hypothetical protein